MKNVFIVCMFCIIFPACNSLSSKENNSASNTVATSMQYQTKKQHKEPSVEVVVVFKKGTSIQEAKDVIHSYGMQILKVYAGISASTGEPMLYISSLLTESKTMQMLRTNPKIISFSINHKRYL